MTHLISRDEAIDVLVKQCGETEEDKGFRDPWFLADELERIAAFLSASYEERISVPEQDVDSIRKAAEALRNMYVSTKLMLVVTELAEAMEALRIHSVEDIDRSNLAEELADSHIRLFALADLLGFDQGQEILKKMGTNSNRPHRHGKKL